MFVIAIWSVMANIAMAQQNETVSEEYDHVTKVNVGEDNFLYIAVRGNFKTRHAVRGIVTLTGASHSLANSAPRSSRQVLSV